MSSQPRIYRADVYESGGIRPRARLTDVDDNVLVQADFSGSCTLEVFDLSSAAPTTAAFTATRSLASVVFNSLQSWTKDDIGYNFGDLITSNELAREGGHTYRISYRLNHATDGTYPVLFEVRCLPLLSL
jgi:hypothetical protein